MTAARPAAVVVDTMVASWLLQGREDELTEAYRSLVGTLPVIVAFQTVMELRYGALQAGWGELRRRRLERSIAEFAVTQPDDTLITVCAELRAACRATGHALAGRVHDGDRWIAATAVRLNLPLVSHDGVFVDAPRLDLWTAG